LEIGRGAIRIVLSIIISFILMASSNSILNANEIYCRTEIYSDAVHHNFTNENVNLCLYDNVYQFKDNYSSYRSQSVHISQILKKSAKQIYPVVKKAKYTKRIPMTLGFNQHYGYITKETSSSKFVVRAGVYTWFLDAKTFCLDFNSGDNVFILGSSLSPLVNMVNISEGNVCSCWVEKTNQ